MLMADATKKTGSRLTFFTSSTSSTPMRGRRVGQPDAESDHRRGDVVDEVGHPEAESEREQGDRSPLDRRHPAHLLHFLVQERRAAGQRLALGRIHPQHQPPGDEDRQDVAGQIGQEPLAPQHVHSADAFDQAARGDRRRAGDDHLVEDGRRVHEDDEHALPDAAAAAIAEGLDQADRDGRHDDDAGDAGRDDERQQEVGDDDAEQQSRVGVADAAHDDEREPARKPRLRRHQAEQDGAEQKPRRGGGKPVERVAESDDACGPEQIQAHQAADRDVLPVRDPRADHERGNRQRLLDLGIDAERGEPDASGGPRPRASTRQAGRSGRVFPRQVRAPWSIRKGQVPRRKPSSLESRPGF